MTAQSVTRQLGIEHLQAQGWTYASAADHVDGLCDPYSCTAPEHAAPADQLSACCTVPVKARAADPRNVFGAWAVVYCPSCARALVMVTR